MAGDIHRHLRFFFITLGSRLILPLTYDLNGYLFIKQGMCPHFLFFYIAFPGVRQLSKGILIIFRQLLYHP